MNFHCVRKGVKAKDVTIDDLTIPDSYCNPKKDSGGHKCPDGFDCINLSKLGRPITGFVGFGDFAESVFTVYQGCTSDSYILELSTLTLINKTNETKSTQPVLKPP